MATVQTITPCLWFDGNAEEAVDFYMSVFRDSAVVSLSRYGESGPGEPGSVMVMTFQLAGQEFMALNGGPMFHFTEALSLSVRCADQDEVDHYWARLSDGGEEGPCGWLKDRFGLSWQIVPAAVGDMLSTGDKAAVDRFMTAMMQMKKLDIATLETAFRGA